MKRSAFFSALPLMVWLFSGPSCNLINPPETLPAYVRIDTIGLVGNPAIQGFLSHNIGDAWIIVNNEISLAAYELPAVFPVLAQGETTLSISPGIRRNGFSNGREPYPLYSFYEVQRNLSPLDTVLLQPEVRYLDDVVFALIENFESGNNFTTTLESTGNFDVTSEPEKVFEGNRSGRILLDTEAAQIEIRSSEKVLPDENLRPVYLEIDYRCNQAFEVWVRSVPLFSGTPVNSYVVTVAPKEDWNKIYVYLSEQLGLLDDVVYQVTLKAIRPADIAEGEILLDNIKLVYR